MDRRCNPDPPAARLARAYLAVRAEQGAERQLRHRPTTLRGTTLLPRLDRVHLNSPEAHAQYRLALLARLATSGEAWFVLATRRGS
jgi:hypothetical protein